MTLLRKCYVCEHRQGAVVAKSGAAVCLECARQHGVALSVTFGEPGSCSPTPSTVTGEDQAHEIGSDGDYSLDFGDSLMAEVARKILDQYAGTLAAVRYIVEDAFPYDEVRVEEREGLVRVRTKRDPLEVYGVLRDRLPAGLHFEVVMSADYTSEPSIFGGTERRFWSRNGELVVRCPLVGYPDA